jgi:hypothetical protein
LADASPELADMESCIISCWNAVSASMSSCEYPAFA